MNPSPAEERRARAWVPVWVTAMLALGASSLAPWLVLAFGTEDTEALESPLVLAVARQLVEGPWGLYGPYGGRNPLVLIHAPLYYRLAALAAWPMARLGLDPVPAALVAGRLLSSLGLVVTLVSRVSPGSAGGGGPAGGVVGRTPGGGHACFRRPAVTRSGPTCWASGSRRPACCSC